MELGGQKGELSHSITRCQLQDELSITDLNRKIPKGKELSITGPNRKR